MNDFDRYIGFIGLMESKQRCANSDSPQRHSAAWPKPKDSVSLTEHTESTEEDLYIENRRGTDSQ